MLKTYVYNTVILLTRNNPVNILNFCVSSDLGGSSYIIVLKANILQYMNCMVATTSIGYE